MKEAADGSSPGDGSKHSNSTLNLNHGQYKIIMKIENRMQTNNKFQKGIINECTKNRDSTTMKLMFLRCSARKKKKQLFLEVNH